MTFELNFREDSYTWELTFKEAKHILSWFYYLIKRNLKITLAMYCQLYFVFKPI